MNRSGVPMRRIVLPAVVLLAIVAAACSTAPKFTEALSNQRLAAPTAVPYANPAEARAAAPAAPVSNDSASGATAARPAAPAQSNGGSAAAVTLPPLDRMIIRTATLSLGVEDVARAFHEVETIADSMGGSVTSSTFKQDGELTTASVVLRIPADQRTYNSTMERLRKLAVRVPEESLSSQDVTEEFVDLDSNLRNLQVTEARLISLIERAQRVDEVIAVQRELTNVRGQIERIEGRRRFLERRSEFTTINLTLKDVAGWTSDQARGWNPVTTFEEAFNALTRSLQGVARAGIWIAVWLPVYGIPFAAVYWIFRQLRRRRETLAA
jgi:hypothetical protein